MLPDEDKSTFVVLYRRMWPLWKWEESYEKGHIEVVVIALTQGKLGAFCQELLSVVRQELLSVVSL